MVSYPGLASDGSSEDKTRVKFIPGSPLDRRHIENLSIHNEFAFSVGRNDCFFGWRPVEVVDICLGAIMHFLKNMFKH